MGDYATSEEARKDGNRFFVERDFGKGQFGAIPALLVLTSQPWMHIRKAADLDPNDWRPLWNISAVHFELGNYNKVATTTSTILNGTQEIQELDRQKQSCYQSIQTDKTD
jgi:hypothetical protein